MAACFPFLHQQLLSQNSPEAWTFVHMEQTEVEYWQQQLSTHIATEVDKLNSESNAQVRNALYELVNGWQDSLRQNEIERLMTAWDDVSGF